MMQLRRALYPCAGGDVHEPLELLAGLVDEVIFVDRRSWRFNETSGALKTAVSPSSVFIVGDIRDVVRDLPTIDILFYRRDSEGEGGSGVFILGDSFLPILLQRFRPTGGFIITDGSNSRGGNFRRMCRKSGLFKWGWRFVACEEQPFRDEYGLWKIELSFLSD